MTRLLLRVVQLLIAQLAQLDVSAKSNSSGQVCRSLLSWYTFPIVYPDRKSWTTRPLIQRKCPYDYYERGMDPRYKEDTVSRRKSAEERMVHRCA